MTGTINIGEQTVIMKATAATEIRYQIVFRSDILTTFFKLYKDLGETLDFTNADPELVNQAVEIAGRLAFIMAKAGEGVDMNSLTMDDFIDWLENFEAMDLLLASGDIFHFWLGQRSTTVKRKNPKAPATTGR